MNAPSWRRTGAGTRRAQHQPGAAQARAQRARMPRRRRRGLRSNRVTHMGSFARHTQSGSRSVSRAQRERSKARPVQLQRHGGFGGSAQIRWWQQLSRRHRTQSAQATGSIQHGHGASHGYVHAALTAGNEQAAVHCGRMDMHSASFLRRYEPADFACMSRGEREKKAEEKEECGNEWHKQTKRRARRRRKGLPCTRRCLPTTRHE